MESSIHPRMLAPHLLVRERLGVFDVLHRVLEPRRAEDPVSRRRVLFEILGALRGWHALDRHVLHPHVVPAGHGVLVGAAAAGTGALIAGPRPQRGGDGGPDADVGHRLGDDGDAEHQEERDQLA